MLSHQILTSVLRPGRYINHEWNALKKDLSKVKFSVCLCYPEVYEIGMSHLGMRILYDILNSKRDVACERAFCPWPDFKDILIKNSLKLTSLESDTALKDFDLLGFSINNELNYTNILMMFSLSDIPFFSKDRGDSFPLIIGGGNCTLNPEPIADFFDAFVIGEAEEVIEDIIKICKDFKKRCGHICKEKEKLLLELSQLPGVYVPQFYHVEYNDDWTIKKFEPLRKNVPRIINKVYLKDINKNLKNLSWIVPNIEIIHDRISIEIMRGCMHKCRFCQARSYFYPLRIRSAREIFKLAKKLYKISGYEEISLLSLSSSDHPQIKEIVKSLLEYFKKDCVSISLPSIRPKVVMSDIANLFSSRRKTGLTFAPEAGSERLRKVIDKDIELDELFQVAKNAFAAGYRRIKLYFMIGLPKEDFSDLDGIIDLSCKISQLRREVCGQDAEINISINTFIPKPHTPFQWSGMSSIDEFHRKQEYLRKLIAGKRLRLKLNFHNIYMGVLEAAFSRGHRGLTKIILSAFKKGAQFDQWAQFFNFKIWQDSFSENGINIEEFASRSIDLNKDLIWDFIDVGIKKDYFVNEFQESSEKI